MKKLLIPFLLIGLLCLLASCGGSMKPGFAFKAGDKSYVWVNGETGVFNEAGIAIQSNEENIYWLSMIASRDVLKSGEKTSDNTISLGIKKTNTAKEPVWVGKNSGRVIFWLDGKMYSGSADINITKFGKVGEPVIGKFSGKAEDVPIEGAFSLQRIGDNALQDDKKNQDDKKVQDGKKN